MKEFKNYHPLVNFAYFGFVIAFSMFFTHPICLFISFCSGFLYSVMQNGKRAVKFNLIYMLPLLIISAIMNPLFNHEGVTILSYFPGGNPLTLESVLYGLAAALMIVSVICHFSCYNEIMTSDKFIYLFGKIIPSLSLLLSMVLRFVPKFKIHLKEITAGQKGIGLGGSEANIVKKTKNGIKILSAMITWALESSIETADSMKSRGYGLPGRTAYSNFIFEGRDKAALICILITGIYSLAGGIAGGMYFRYFPSVKGTEISFYSISVFTAYCVLFITPIVIELVEEIKWRALESKI